MAIDIGPGVDDHSGVLASYTLVSQVNPANADGTIDHLEVQMVSGGSAIELASFDHEGSNVLSTNGVSGDLGATTIGFNEWDAPGDFTAFNVEAGEYLGCYYPSGTIELEGTGSTGIWYVASTDHIPASSVSFTSNTDLTIAIYGTGVESSGSTLLPNELNQSQSIDNLDLIQQNMLAIDSLNQSQAIDNIDLIQANIIIISDLEQSQTIENLDLIQQNLLSINPINQNQTLDNLDLIQANIIVINDIDQSQSIDNVVLQTGIILQINDISQTQTLDNLDLIQANVLAIGDIEQVQTIDNIILDIGVILQIADIIQNQTIENLDLSQANTLAINDLIQSQTIDTITFARLEGKVTITFVLSKPGISHTLSSPGVTFKGE